MLSTAGVRRSPLLSPGRRAICSRCLAVLSRASAPGSPSRRGVTRGLDPASVTLPSRGVGSPTAAPIDATRPRSSPARTACCGALDMRILLGRASTVAAPGVTLAGAATSTSAASPPAPPSFDLENTTRLGFDAAAAAGVPEASPLLLAPLREAASGLSVLARPALDALLAPALALALLRRRRARATSRPLTASSSPPPPPAAIAMMDTSDSSAEESPAASGVSVTPGEGVSDGSRDTASKPSAGSRATKGIGVPAAAASATPPTLLLAL